MPTPPRDGRVQDLLSVPVPTGWRAWILRIGTAWTTTAITAASVAMSLAVTFAVTHALGDTDSLSIDLAIAALVPLIVAPAVSVSAMRLLHEVEDARRLMREAAIRDGLTNLYNRRFFVARLQAEVQRSQRDRDPLSVILIDVDHFKLINDRRGHATGDEVTAERIRQAIAGLRLPSFGDAAGPHVTASLGVSTLTGPDDTFAALLSRADQAMYRAKADGRNRCVVHADEARRPQPA
jgi:GGDEF domain-containing protein